MKHIYTFLIWLLFPLFCFSQNNKSAPQFEGIITYSLIIESNNPTLNSRELQKMFGDTMQLYIKANNYKMVFSGSYAKEILYTGEENKHYISLGPIDSLIWRYCNENASSVIYTRAIDNADYVLDYPCDAYCIQTDWGLTTYYYSPQLKLNPRNYTHHVFNYFNVYVQYARAPYLKYVYTGPSFKLTLTAVNIETQTLERTAFNAVWRQNYATAETESVETPETDPDESVETETSDSEITEPATTESETGESEKIE